MDRRIPAVDFPFALTVSLIVGWWTLCILALWLWKRTLLRTTWLEPYFADVPVLIESDDWGPGGDFHKERLEDLLALLQSFHDQLGRDAVLTANMVLAVPDTADTRDGIYKRVMLDEGFGDLCRAFQQAATKGSLVPQLHGLEHCNGQSLATLYQAADPRVSAIFGQTGWWDWESLDSPLQGHFVDNTRLPTRPLTQQKVEQLVSEASAYFTHLFGYPSYTAVAPCYLWDNQVELAWQRHGVKAVQTAGYRCTGRDGGGRYLQDKPLIRPGYRSDYQQTYLVRNVMFEPTDGKTDATSAWREACTAYAQGLPISISTHRYNFTRDESEHRDSLQELEVLLNKIGALPGLRFISSPELAQAIECPEQVLRNPFAEASSPPLERLKGPAKVAAFCNRLTQRHPKLRLLVIYSGLIVPAALVRRCYGRGLSP